MNTDLIGLNSWYPYAVVGILLFFSLLEAVSGYLTQSNRKPGDWIQEVGAFGFLTIIIKPGIVLAILILGQKVVPSLEKTYEHISIWIMLPVFLFVDDLLQYLYHRFAHQNDFFWKLHRAHHQAEEMGFFVSYRNAGLYYLLMPNIWWLAALTFLGAGKAIAIGLVAKQLVIISSHSRIKWDKAWYKTPVLKSAIKIIQRVIVTPAFHHAHHGVSRADGVSDPNGNFGNMFSIWDQMFGTAVFTGKFPEGYGLQKPTNDHWSAAFFYPILHSTEKESELAKGFVVGNTRTAEPTSVILEKDKNYLWCKCGRSKNQPFCDGSHHGTKYKPEVFSVKRDGNYKLCNCKLTNKSPFCDGSHAQLQ